MIDVPRLEFRHIGKTFPGVRALADVGFQVRAGSVHGLLGENGAGKSTMMKILGGEYIPDEGEVAIDGQPMNFRKAADAIDAGVAVIHQELQYVPELSVMENLLLGRLPTRFGLVDRRKALAWTRQRLDALGVDLDPRAKLKQLSIGQRQMVEIVKAILRDATILALDEPTSSLSHRETDVLFRLVRDLRAQGKAMIYISHRLDEIFELCDAATIFRDGRKVADFETLEGVTRDTLVERMVGRDIGDIWGYKPREHGDIRLSVKGVSGRAVPQPVSFDVKAGEIVGFFGLVGAGRSEIMRVIYGADRRLTGDVAVDGKPVKASHIRDAIRHGLVLCPEDRKEDGIIGVRSVAENINISARRNHLTAGLFVNDAVEAKTADGFIERLRIRTPHRRQEIRLLSGGNQQKAVLSRWLAEKDLRVLIVDEPTRGIDVGAKNEIYNVLYELAGRGVAVVMISSELPEVLGVSDRVIAMCRGRIVAQFARGEANETNVLAAALPEGASATPTPAE
ncbi:L-arabinose transport system ATP-binding protein [Luteibacter sp. UNCMF331Sha3.1]|uniref:L-arabinose ABC transporter ATP-binding protein AraG n=1 Tax=Luteibacter sp. UNCMF331Sha3.1 TaxID=1502760 RepID=UPI0008C851BC|nr:L-arabinose ABC transporter ATP-binding protein AraG [Luteibacter sp. UNCMF331Sha3.1]SEM44463.1 L-arabinose transport system ATP-binding protein [Luteibacter sp. UNCMF331Sha3.1]